MGRCEDCYFKGNAVFESNQVGITIHGTHGSKVEENTLWNPRAIGIYTEDGNEMDNRIAYNAIICADPSECHVNFQEFRGPGESMGGLYLIGMTNDVIGNHVAAHENGAWFNGAARPRGHGAAKAQSFRAVCTVYQPFGKVQGNVFHDNWRFGMYPDNQHPRNLKVDPSTGYLTDPSSCEAFLPDGSDNGIDTAALIEDQFDWHNMFVGQYDAGDIRWIRYVGVDNAASMYWKSSKNFKDGSLHHVADSIFAALPNTVLPGLGKTCLSLLIGNGPFTFGMSNVTLVGGPTCGGALKLGQHCGHAGAGSPCNAQYLLENIRWDVEPGQVKVKWGVNNLKEDPAAEVAGVLIAREGDDSLGGHRSIVSAHLNGFGSEPECTKLGKDWAYGYGCSFPVRRLNVWPLGSARTSFGSGNHMRDLELSGPGYRVSPNWAYPIKGQNAGRMLYSPLHKGFGLPVVVGRRYTLQVSAQLGNPVIEFSDLNLNRELGTDEAIDMTVQGGVNPLTCTLRGLATRPWMSVLGSRGLKEASELQGGCLDRAGDIGVPTPGPSVPAPTPAPNGVPSPVPSPLDGWAHHPGTNCYQGVGGVGVPGKDPAVGDYTAAECKALCEEVQECVGVVVVNNLDRFKCWLRKDLNLDACITGTTYDLWERVHLTPAPTLAPTTISPTLSPTPVIPGPAKWIHHPGTNCFEGVGGIGLPGKDPVPGDYTASECKSLCEEEVRCVGVVVVRSLNKYKCWQRKELNLDLCMQSGAYDLWERA